MVAPEEDFDVNCHATVKLLEALRRSGRGTPLVFASTNKVYGDLTGVELAMHEASWQPVDAGLAAAGVNESQPLAFCTPYGCSTAEHTSELQSLMRIPSAVLCLKNN